METGVKAGAGADVLAFGEVLWDIIGGDAHIGGAPFNFAAHVVKCGFSAAIASMR
jgi:fructokinase